jgi:hypothetical protein
MINRIFRVSLRDHSLLPAAADIRVVVETEHNDAGTEIRGRFVGPRCLFAETIEVAYPIRRAGAEYRVVIPEGSFWDPASPFLYLVHVELWQDGSMRDEVRLRHGLRDLRCTARGLTVNGQRQSLRGRAVERLDDDEARRLRADGYNLVIAAADEPGTWEIADRVGFFVLGSGIDAALAEHPSHLGWLAEGQFEVRDGRLFAAWSDAPIGEVEEEGAPADSGET